MNNLRVYTFIGKKIRQVRVQLTTCDCGKSNLDTDDCIITLWL